MDRSIFDSNFWVSTTIIMVVFSIVFAIVSTTYITIKANSDALAAGFEECMIIRPNGNYDLLWKKECPGGVINLYKQD